MDTKHSVIRINRPKMRIFLTGGRGMVGRNFLEHPATADFDVIAPSSAELDLLDYEAVVGSIEKCKPDIVVHAAGKVGGIQGTFVSL